MVVVFVQLVGSPGVFKAMSTTRRLTSSVRASDAPAGSWVTPMR